MSRLTLVFLLLGGCGGALGVPEALPTPDQIQSGLYRLTDRPVAAGCDLPAPPYAVRDVAVPALLREGRLALTEILVRGFGPNDAGLGASIGRSQYWLDEAQGWSSTRRETARSTEACPGVNLDLEYQLLPSAAGRLQVAAETRFTVDEACPVPIVLGGRDAPTKTCSDERILDYTLELPCSPPCELVTKLPDPGSGSALAGATPWFDGGVTYSCRCA